MEDPDFSDFILCCCGVGGLSRWTENPEASVQLRSAAPNFYT
jgi:hypothetical protein